MYLCAVYISISDSVPTRGIRLSTIICFPNISVNHSFCGFIRVIRFLWATIRFKSILEHTRISRDTFLIFMKYGSYVLTSQPQSIACVMIILDKFHRNTILRYFRKIRSLFTNIFQ